MSNDQIWEELSKVYNMSDVPEEAKEIIGNLMLALDDDGCFKRHGLSSSFGLFLD